MASSRRLSGDGLGVMDSRHAKVGDFQDRFSALLDAENVTRLKVTVTTLKLFMKQVKSGGETQHLLQSPQRALPRRLLFRGFPELLQVSPISPWENDVPFFTLVDTSEMADDMTILESFDLL